MIVYGHDAAVAEWMGGRLDTVFAPPYVALGVTNSEGRLVGGLLFNDYNGQNIEVTAYGPGAVTKESVGAMFNYAFVQLGCWRLTARTRRSNHTMRELLTRLGFKHEGIQQGYWGRSKANDCFLYGMTRQNCKWITPHAIEQSANPA